MTEIITGDDTVLTVTLLDSAGMPFPVDGSQTLLLALVRVDRASRLIEPIQANPLMAGALWADGVVPVLIPGLATKDIMVARAELEVQATWADGRVRTWVHTTLGDIKITRGLI